MLHTQKNKQAICIWDPAIDPKATNLANYVQRRDLTKVVYRAGTKPEVYHLRPLNHEVCAWVCAAPDGPERQNRAFFACVVQVDGLKIVSEDGVLIKEHESWAPDATRDKPERLLNMFDLFSKEERKIFSPATVYEIGEVAWRYSFFPKEIAPLFALPLTSEQIWLAAASSRPAELEPNTDQPGTSETPQL